MGQKEGGPTETGMQKKLQPRIGEGDKPSGALLSPLGKQGDKASRFYRGRNFKTRPFGPGMEGDKTSLDWFKLLSC